MSMQSRKEVVKQLVRKYRRAGEPYRRKLVDELCSACGYERKYAIKVLNGNRPGPRCRRRGGGARLHDEPVAQVAAAIWKPTRRSRRLKHRRRLHAIGHIPR